MGLAVGLIGITLLFGSGLIWTAYLVRAGNLDAQALAEKVAVPQPSSALDWPELHVQAVVAQPDQESLVLLHVDWPAFPQRNATLLVSLNEDDPRSLLVLSRWCACQASVSPTRRYGATMELRRRQSLQRVSGVLLAEHPAPGYGM
ncbi:hypothetical protein ACQPW1_19990 [Nocardia sp. CA-128927]|uniref:hypothetical protein n=1 Tax=Nocardia sp. CA-128927 TaxID=3239975 RepID=UPI003D951082